MSRCSMRSWQIVIFAITAASGCTCADNQQLDGGDDAQADIATVDAGGDALENVDGEAGADACAQATAEGNVIGCDYVAISPSVMGSAPGGCLATVIINNNDAPASIQVTYQTEIEPLSFHTKLVSGEGQSATYSDWPSNDEIPPHSTAVLSLAQGVLNQDGTACPLPPMVGEADEYKINALPNGTAYAFRIKTGLPTVAYEVWAYTQNDIDVGNVVALRAVPSWASSYIDVGTYLPGCDAGGAELATGNTWTAAVAQASGTVMSLPSAQNGTITATLNANQLLNVARCDEFIGQTVAAKLPFSLWTGTAGIQVPFYDDSATENAARSRRRSRPRASRAKATSASPRRSP